MCGLAAERCSNGGYTQRDCSCACPTGTIGSRCENVTGNYYGKCPWQMKTDPMMHRSIIVEVVLVVIVVVVVVVVV